MFFSVFSLLCLCRHLFICALWSADLLALVVMSNCEFVTFPLVSWVTYGPGVWYLILSIPDLCTPTYFV